MKQIKVDTWLPVFPGFYGTIFEPDESNEIEHWNTERTNKGLTELEFDQFEFDYESYESEYGKQSTGIFHEYIKYFVSEMNYQDISSPREYNFKNDSINIECVFTLKDLYRIKKLIKKYSKQWSEYLKGNYTNYDGFMSWHSNKVEDWDINECINDSHCAGAILDFINDVLCLESDSCSQETMYYDNEVYPSIKNIEQVENMEYCKTCFEWVNPDNYNGNCCNECNDFKVQNFSRIV